MSELTSRIRFRRGRTISAVALATSLALTACHGSTNEPSSNDQGSGQSGGTLKVATGAGLICIDPQQTVNFDARAIGRSIADSLTDIDPTTGKVVGWLATSWKVNANATTYTFHLRTGVTFSDGTPLTAQVVVDNLNTIKKVLGGKAARASAYLSNYSSSIAVNSQTVEIKFSKPSAQFLIATATTSLAILSESTLKESAAARCEGKIVGSGPFVLAEFKPNETAEIKRRTGYKWASSTAQNHGDSYLDKIDFQVVPVSSVEAGALRSGQVQVATGLAPQDIATVSTGAGDQVVSAIQPGVPINDFLNTTSGPLADPAVRQALQLGIDRQTIVSSILGNRFKAATSVLSSASIGYADLSSDLAYSPEKAEQTLDAASWKKGPNGIREKDSKPLSLHVIYTSDFGPAFESIAQVIQQEWKTIGVDSSVSSVTSSALLAAIANGSFDIILTSFTDTEPDILPSFVAAYFPDKQSLVSSGFQAAFAQSRKEIDTASRVTALQDVQRILVEHHFLLPIAESAQTAAHSATVHGLHYDSQAVLVYYDAWTK